MADAKLQTRIRREQIAEAALKLVASEGVKRLNIAAVARRVGLVPSGIYRHFKSKDAMLDAVLDLLDSKLQANVDAARKETSDLLGRLHDLFLRHIRIIREGQAFPRIIFSDEALAAQPQRKKPRAADRGRLPRRNRTYGPRRTTTRAYRPATAAPHGGHAVPGHDCSRGRGLAPHRRRLQPHATCRPRLENVSAGLDRGQKWALVVTDGLQVINGSQWMHPRDDLPCGGCVVAIAAGSWYVLHFAGVTTIAPCSGNIEAVEVAVSFKIPGRVEKRYVDEGEPVKEGQPVAQLETADLQADAALAEPSCTRPKPRWPSRWQGPGRRDCRRLGRHAKGPGELCELKNGSRPEEIAASEAEFHAAEVDRDHLNAITIATNNSTALRPLG